MTVGVAFADFSPLVLRDIQIVRDALTVGGDVAFTGAEDADVLVYGDNGRSHQSFVGTKVYYTGENHRPRWAETDFAIGFDYLSDSRYLRAPFHVVEAYRDHVEGFSPGPGPAWADRSFCNFIYFRPGARMRRLLFDELNRYREVTSPGRFLKNASAPELSPRNELDWRWSKISYQRHFRFTIAAENGAHPGYTTEKLYDALLAGTIPIYWGDPRVTEDIDERAFINCDAYAKLGDVVDLVREIDTHPELARPYLEARPFLRTPVEVWFRRVVDFFEAVKEHAGRHRGDAEQRLRAEGLAVASNSARIRAVRLMRSMPGAISTFDKRWLGGVLHRAYDRVPGAERIVKAMRGPGFPPRAVDDVVTGRDDRERDDDT